MAQLRHHVGRIITARDEQRRERAPERVRRQPLEEDHLISLELGGSPTSSRNLWPEAHYPRPGSYQKDGVENYLHRQVCSGAVTLRAAQHAEATNWVAVYRRTH